MNNKQCAIYGMFAGLAMATNEFNIDSINKAATKILTELGEQPFNINELYDFKVFMLQIDKLSGDIMLK